MNYNKKPSITVLSTHLRISCVNNESLEEMTGRKMRLSCRALVLKLFSDF